MAEARGGGTVVAQAGARVVVEGNRYFPPESVNGKFLQPSEHFTACPGRELPTTIFLSLTAPVTRISPLLPATREAAKEIQDRSAPPEGAVARK
jgi:hypothetical protein